MTARAPTPRRLPFHVPAVRGESFISYAQRLACEHNTSVASLLSATGVTDATALIRSAELGIRLEPEDLRAFAEATGLHESGVANMTMSRFAPILDNGAHALNEPCPAAGRPWADAMHPQMCAVCLTGSPICPACVSETGGAWQLAWKLPWAFACTRHKLLLIDECPSCRLRPGSGFTGRGLISALNQTIDRLDLCNNPALGRSPYLRGGVARCDQELAALQLETLNDFNHLVETQRTLDERIDGQTCRVAGMPVTARAFFNDFRFVLSVILAGVDPNDVGALPAVVETALHRHLEQREQGGRAHTEVCWFKRRRREAALMAALAPTAIEILNADTAMLLNDQLAPILERHKHVTR